jgi:hypothetical protein
MSSFKRSRAARPDEAVSQLSGQWSAPRHELKNQHDQRQNQQYVDESTQRVTAHQTKQPQYQEDYKYRPKHALHLSQE